MNRQEKRYQEPEQTGLPFNKEIDEEAKRLIESRKLIPSIDKKVPAQSLTPEEQDLINAEKNRQEDIDEERRGDQPRYDGH